MNSATSFGRWVKEQRKRLDLTQKDLAQRIGCSLSTIQKIEIGQRQPSRQIAELLAEHLEIGIEQQSSFIHLARTQSTESLPVPSVELPPPQPINNLSTPLTPLIGRDLEVKTISASLLGDDVRLLTISGPPGIGKTRLALQVAKTLLPHYRDGVCFVALAPISEVRSIIPAIAQTLKVAETKHLSLSERLKSYLRNKQMLLVLDNFEHLMTGAPWIAELLESAPHLNVLVTSRATLRLYGEHEFVTSPLGLPDIENLPPFHILSGYAAIELFIQRARAVKSEFALNEQNGHSVAEICVYLDGLPLAIELAAARSKELTPKALLARLINPSGMQIVRLGMLAGGPSNLPPRQQTLRNAIEWSYNLLTPTEQRIFRSLGVFVGGCNLAALSVLHGFPKVAHIERTEDRENWLQQTIHSLVNKSLVVRQAETGSESRIMLLEMIRAYALEQLTLNGEIEDIRQVHANYFLCMAEEVVARSHTTHGDEIWAPLRVEQDNLRAALRWTLINNESMALSLATALAAFWNNEESFSETSEWLGRILAQVTPQSSRCYADAACRFGVSLWMQGEYTSAQHWFSESVARWRSLKDESELAIALHFQALVWYYRDEYEAALIPAKEAVALLRTQQKPIWLATALNILGMAYSAMGDYAMASSVLEECLQLFQQHKHDWGVALALLGLADIPYAEGDYGAAHAYIEEAVRLYRRLRERWFLSQTLLYLGKILWHQDAPSQAIACWEESVMLGRRVGGKGFVAGSLLLLGFATLQQGDIEQAQLYLDESLAIYQQIEHNAGIGYALSGLVGVMVYRGHEDMEQRIKATRILGAVATLLASRSKLLDDIEKSHYMRIVAEVSAQLSDATFTTARAEGERWTLDQCLLAVSNANSMPLYAPGIE